MLQFANLLPAAAAWSTQLNTGQCNNIPDLTSLLFQYVACMLHHSARLLHPPREVQAGWHDWLLMYVEAACQVN